jgi:hypothetical protein
VSSVSVSASLLHVVALGVVLVSMGCALHVPAAQYRQYHLVAGADPTPVSTAVNMREANFGLGVTPGLLNTGGTTSPGCARQALARRPGTANRLPAVLSFEFRDQRLLGVFLAEEHDQSTNLGLLCQGVP